MTRCQTRYQTRVCRVKAKYRGEDLKFMTQISLSYATTMHLHIYVVAATILTVANTLMSQVHIHDPPQLHCADSDNVMCLNKNWHLQVQAFLSFPN